MLEEDPHRQLKSYLGYSHHEFINYQLNPDSVDPKMDSRIEEVNHSLDQAEAYNNAIVHHCGEYAGIAVDILSPWFQKRIGKFIQMPTFFSTTRNADLSFKEQEKVFEIHTSSNSNGKDVATLGFSVSTEGEITFKSGTFYKIVDVTYKLITLEELTFVPQDPEILCRDYFKTDPDVMAYFKEQEAKRRHSETL